MRTNTASHGALCLRPTQSLDAEGVREWRDAAERIVARAESDVQLDLTRVPFIDGSGVGMIAFLAKRLAARGHRLNLTGVDGQPRELLELLGLARRLGIAPAPVRDRVDPSMFRLLRVH